MLTWPAIWPPHFMALQDERGPKLRALGGPRSQTSARTGLLSWLLSVLYRQKVRNCLHTHPQEGQPPGQPIRCWSLPKVGLVPVMRFYLCCFLANILFGFYPKRIFWEPKKIRFSVQWSQKYRSEKFSLRQIVICWVHLNVIVTLSRDSQQSLTQSP